ncbi:flowering time control protein FCA-like, partial [Asparagus officinalis]|uniref:flowering time control protein FCA-like n=1 Tax=Asparagus officinalis TaxID=4686 RepID=UPI00098E7721
PQDYRTGGGPGFRLGPAGVGRGFHGPVRDGSGGGSLVKLFVGAIPRTATEGDVRPLFEEHGDVCEVIFVKDRITGQQQSYCFIKYAMLGDAERAIEALHNQYTLPGGSGPIQVRYADGERERLGISRPRLFSCAFDKLFVASLSKEATEKEIEEIFSPYGRVEDIYILKDDMKQNRGCCFVKLANREMAAAAISDLHGTYVMSGCDQPLIVRFADPKKPKGGELRSDPTFRGPVFHSPPAVVSHRVKPDHTELVDGHLPPNTSRLISQESDGPSSQVDIMGIPADRTNITQSSLAVSIFSPQQVQQIEQLQTSLIVADSPPIQQNSQADATRTPLSLQRQGVSDLADQQKLPVTSISQQLLQTPLRQSPSSLRQSLQNSRTQSASSPPTAPATTMSSVVSIAIPSARHMTFHISCNWSEHTCPDGFKYYYNCITRESMWEKPDEYAHFEQTKQQNQQQQRKPALQSKLPNAPSQTQLKSQSQSPQVR